MRMRLTKMTQGRRRETKGDRKRYRSNRRRKETGRTSRQEEERRRRRLKMVPVLGSLALSLLNSTQVKCRLRTEEKKRGMTSKDKTRNVPHGSSSTFVRHLLLDPVVASSFFLSSSLPHSLLPSSFFTNFLHDDDALGIWSWERAAKFKQETPLFLAPREERRGRKEDRGYIW